MITVTIEGKGAERFAEALWQHFNIVQIKTREIVLEGETCEFESEPGAPMLPYGCSEIVMVVKP